MPERLMTSQKLITLLRRHAQKSAAINFELENLFPEGAECKFMLSCRQMIATKGTILSARMSGGHPQVVVRLSAVNRWGYATVKRVSPENVIVVEK